MADQVKVELVVNSTQAQKSIDDFAKNTSKSLSAIEGSVGGLGAVMEAIPFVAIGLIAVKALEAIKDSIAHAVTEAAAADDSIRKMNVALAHTAGVSSSSADGFESLAEQLEKTTALTDDQARELIALAANYGIAGDKIEETVRAAIELSAVTGKDVKTSLTALDSAMKGNIGTLGKNIDEVQNLTKAQLRNGEATTIILEKFKGTAEFLNGGYNGAVKNVTKSYDNYQKAIGTVITRSPVVLAALEALAEHYQDLTDDVEDNESALREWVNAGVIKAVEAVDKLSSVLGFLNFVAKSLTEAIILLPSVFSAFNAEVAEGALKVVGFLVDKFAGLIVVIKDVVTSVSSLSVFQTISDAIKPLGVDIDDLSNKFIDFSKSTAESIKKTAETITTQGAKLGTEIRNNTSEFDSLAASAAVPFDAANKAIMKVGDSAERLAEKLKTIGAEGQAASNKFIGPLNKVPTLFELIEKEAKAKILGIASPIANIVKSFQKLNFKFDKLEDAQLAMADLKAAVASAIPLAQELNKAFQVSIDVAKLKRDIAQFAASIPVQLAEIQAKNAREVEAMLAKIPAALDKVRQASLKEGDEKLKALQESRKSELQTIEDKAKAEGASTEDLAKIRADFQIETEKKLADQREKNAIDVAKAVADEEKRLQDEIAAFKLKVEDDLANKRLDLEAQLEKMRRDSEVKAQEAATKLFGQATAFFVNTVFPGFGDVVGNFVAGLATGGKFLKDSILSIVAAVPAVLTSLAEGITGLLLGLILSFDDLILGIIKGAALFVSTIVQQAPDIILALVALAPAIIAAQIEAIPQLVLALVAAMPLVALGLAKALITQAPGIVRSLVKGLIEGFVNGIIVGFESIINGFISFLNSLPFVHVNEVSLPRLTLATGGTIPNGFSGDNFPASLQSGEMVIPRDDTDALREFLARQNAPDGGRDLEAIGRRIDGLQRTIERSSQKDLTINVMVSSKVLASALVEIDRQGYRAKA